jgi:prolyl-tRNA synthetase
LARPGDLAENGQPLRESRGIEVGNIFQLGYHYSSLMSGANFTDVDGQEKPFYMGCYGIGIGRTMAAIVEAHNDDKGILWPEAVAPFQVHLILLEGKDGANVRQAADKVYAELQAAGIEVLYDERDGQTAGEKFADSDLIGIPLRIVVSTKTLAENSVEIKKRSGPETWMAPLEGLIENLIKYRFPK